jgi:hypothetical protein
MKKFGIVFFRDVAKYADGHALVTVGGLLSFLNAPGALYRHSPWAAGTGVGPHAFSKARQPQISLLSA